MNYYQITINNLEGFDTNLIHSYITEKIGVADWWHYLPSAYLVETSSSSYFLAQTIISMFPGLTFLITKIDVNDYNGYLDKKAWQWLEAKIVKNRPGRLPPITTQYVSHASSPLQDLLGGFKPKSTDLSVNPLLDFLKTKK